MVLLIRRRRPDLHHELERGRLVPGHARVGGLIDEDAHLAYPGVTSCALDSDLSEGEPAMGPKEVADAPLRL